LVFQRQAVFPKCCASAQRLNEAMSVRTSWLDVPPAFNVSCTECST
jgi:hypothetical protein